MARELVVQYQSSCTANAPANPGSCPQHHLDLDYLQYCCNYRLWHVRWTQGR